MLRPIYFCPCRIWEGQSQTFGSGMRAKFCIFFHNAWAIYHELLFLYHFFTLLCHFCVNIFIILLRCIPRNRFGSSANFRIAQIWHFESAGVSAKNSRIKFTIYAIYVFLRMNQIYPLYAFGAWDIHIIFYDWAN